MMKELPKFLFSLREDLKDEKQFLPARAEPLASGWDVRAAMPDRKPLFIWPNEYVKIPLGVRAFCPPGWWYRLAPRSSSFTKKNLHALYGTIDETYPDELVFAAHFIPGRPVNQWMTREPIDRSDILKIEFGEAIAQIIPVQRQEMIVEEVGNVELEEMYQARNAVRNGGFGSTSK